MNRWSGLVAACGVLVPMVFGLSAQKPDAAGQQRELPYSDTFNKCSASAESTQAIVECHVAETALWDKRLNVAYQAFDEDLHR